MDLMYGYCVGNSEDPLHVIAENISMLFDSPIKTYLIQHAIWKPTEDDEKIWIACSPISINNDGILLPLSDENNIQYSNETNIVFKSIEKQHPNANVYPGYGNIVGYFPNHIRRHLSGTIWTCID